MAKGYTGGDRRRFKWQTWSGHVMKNDKTAGCRASLPPIRRMEALWTVGTYCIYVFI